MTKLQEYFHVGDYVETVDGRVGFIKDICNCSECQKRGFLEPIILYYDGSEDSLTKYQLNNLDKLYKRIGSHTYNCHNTIEEIVSVEFKIKDSTGQTRTIKITDFDKNSDVTITNDGMKRKIDINLSGRCNVEYK